MTKIFTVNEIAEQMNELERMAEEKLQEKVSKKRVRRVQKKKNESCPLSPGVVSSSAEPSPVKGHSRKLSTEELNKEKADRDWIEFCKFVEKYDFENNEVEPQDFEGNFERDPQSGKGLEGSKLSRLIL